MLPLLASCVTRAESFAQDRQTCADIGFAPDTDQYKDCLLRLQASRLQGHHGVR
jgi:hypothetical protein